MTVAVQQESNGDRGTQEQQCKPGQTRRKHRE
jgi:hypothetical protein